MRQRTIKKQIWINNDEEKLLKEKSKKAGLTEAEFLRSLIKGYKLKEQPTKEIIEFTKQISGIANNINQITKAIYSLGYVKDNYLEYIKNTIPTLIRDFKKKIYTRGDEYKWRLSK